VRAEEIRESGVEAVQPNDGGRAVVAVVVPGPARRDDKIAGTHGDTLAVDRGVSALALHHEAQGVGRVAVRGRDLAGQDRL